MKEILFALAAIWLICTFILNHVKRIDREEALSRKLERLTKSQSDLAARLDNLNESLKSLGAIGDKGDNNMAYNDTNVVFRCSSAFKDKIETWASEHTLNLSEACRELIKLELCRDECLIDMDDFNQDYVQFLRTLGLVPQEVTDEKIAEAAKLYANHVKTMKAQ